MTTTSPETVACRSARPVAVDERRPRQAPPSAPRAAPGRRRRRAQPAQGVQDRLLGVGGFVTGSAADGAGAARAGAGRGRRGHLCRHTVAAAAGAIKRRNLSAVAPVRRGHLRFMAAVLGSPSLSSAIWPVAWGGTPPSSWGSCWSRSSRPGHSCVISTTRSPRRRPVTPGVYVWNTWVFQHELQQGRLPFYTSSILSGTPDAAPANLSLHNYTTVANVLAWPLDPAGRPGRGVQPGLPLQHRALRLRRLSAGARPAPRATPSRGSPAPRSRSRRS